MIFIFFLQFLFFRAKILVLNLNVDDEDRSWRIFFAKHFFKHLHRKQKRKYTNLPYFTHLEEVVAHIKRIPHTPEMIIAGYGHDSIEDQGITTVELIVLFGARVTIMIDGLSDKYEDLKFGNRLRRKYLEAQRMRYLDNEIKTIKVCDVLSNTLRIADADPKFAMIYIPEKEELLHSLVGANPLLLELAYAQINRAKIKLGLV